MDVPEQAMRRALDKPGRSERMMLRNRVCKPCGRRFASKPRYISHIAIHVLCHDTGVSWAEGERLWKRYGWSLVEVGDDGTRRMVLPDGEPGE